MKRALMISLTGLLLAAGGLPSAPGAELRLRVSVKIILDADGNRPASGPYNTDQEIRDEIAYANQILLGMRRGYEFQLTEIVSLAGVSQWFSVEARSLMS